MLPFLNYHLKSDCDEGTIFDNLLTTPVGSTTQSNCMVPDPSVCATCANVDLDIQFDGFPAQTSWEIVDANNVVVASSNGPYTGIAGNSSTTETTCLADGCYTLNFYDGLNNGMCPFQSSAVGVSTFITPGTLITPGSIVGTLSLVATPGLCGNYTLSNSAGTTLVSGGGGFGAQESQTFCLTGGMKVGSNISSAKVNVYPNPVKHRAFVQGDDRIQEVSIYSTKGQLVKRFIQEDIMNHFSFSVDDLSNGVYWMEIQMENGIEFERLVKR